MIFDFWLTLSILIVVDFFTSCAHWGGSENRQLIHQARQLIDQQPDSALTLLYAVNIASLGKAAMAEYTLLCVQAKDNLGKDLTSDTEIFEARQYFTGKMKTRIRKKMDISANEDIRDFLLRIYSDKEWAHLNTLPTQ